ncbi:uncharacterized protein LOC134840000 isoform X2 [Symsagittifera roscoffensis]
MANTSYGTEGSCAESTDSSSPFMSDGTKEKSPLVGRSSTKKGASSSSKHNNLELHDASQSGKERKTGEQAIDECALTGEVAKSINYFSLQHVGLFLQYFCVGICYSCTISINYEFFTSYMGQSGNFYNVAHSAIALPWSLKIIYGAINDCFPLRGYRRKPYMVLGWIGCTAMALVLTFQPLPGSRFERPEEAIENGNCSVKGVIKENSEEEYKDESLKFMTLLATFNVFLVLTDVAMDGLMVQYARKEPMNKRGKAQTMIYVTRSIGMSVGAILKGVGLNWYEYSGPWCEGIEVSVIFLIVAATSCCAIPVTILMTTEDTVSESKSIKHIMSKVWALLQNTAVQQVLVFQIGSSIVMSISSPADSMIQIYWVGVDNLTKNILVGVFGQLTFSLGSTIFAKFLIDFNWKKIFGSTAVIVLVMNASLTYIVIYDVIRNQYFYLSDELTTEFFVGANYICGLLLFIELSESDTEGIAYALMTTTSNASMSIGSLIGNFAVYMFHVSEHGKYTRDNTNDRNIVAANYAIIYLLNACIIFLLPILPKGKKDTQQLKQNAKVSKPAGAALIVTILSFVSFSILYNFVLYRYIG